MPPLPVSHITTIPLRHNGDCSLIGVTPDGMIYAEEVYGDDAWVAQHALKPDGTVVESIDELDGTAEIRALDLPPVIAKPKTAWQTMTLNFAGARHRGMREPERLLDLVQTLSFEEKLTLVERLNPKVAPPYLLGIAESYVLSEAPIARPALYFVCRRVRLALALPEAQIDADGQPYDYDTPVIYLAHFYDCNEALRVSDCLADLTGVPLHRPMDCLLVGDLLYIADGGSDERPSAIHVWQVELPEVLSAEEKLRRKIYG